MKKVIAVLALFLCGQASAADFETSQHNFQIESGDYSLEVREEINSQKDHIQVGYTGINKLKLEARYVDKANDAEYRVRGTYNLISTNNFYFKPRIEYRHFETSTDYWRVRTKFGAKFNYANMKFYGEFQPAWNFGGDKTNDAKMDSSEFSIGIDTKVNDKITFGPFLLYETDKNFNKTNVFLGTNLKVKF